MNAMFEEKFMKLVEENGGFEFIRRTGATWI